MVDSSPLGRGLCSSSQSHVFTSTCPYRILGVNNTAELSEIKSAYLSQVRKVHPDMNQDDPQACMKFAKVHSAYELLNNQEKRLRYDHGLIDVHGRDVPQALNPDNVQEMLWRQVMWEGRGSIKEFGMVLLFLTVVVGIDELSRTDLRSAVSANDDSEASEVAGMSRSEPEFV
ncbi:hypothetical protein GUITHDRAFT_155385 [Guillardia theta CCMP2712]|uniref:J domain-containing protein n=2 Tax=Guillardia theta TaxID=55529 RepID=L1IIW9_GUITC|nr:hypothetical protein GUITHDRAFT_155385 [Guillardia theta CCMP2712]EKX35854.1 hypothetical protein GUITHDRAFT_155385 [Guillardia theta CCMP2712]|eukprot:XP_005822834.1 hypothetical protein GUITHDRAFT_155385 [Guillardia theta CCMP2712]